MQKTKRIASVIDLIKGIESIKSKNRNLLSGDEVEILEECLQTLKEVQSRQELEDSLDTRMKIVKVIVTLVKFFIDKDDF